MAVVPHVDTALCGADLIDRQPGMPDFGDAIRDVDPDHPVQRILVHASATMTKNLYGHLYDQNLWTAAKQVGGLSGASEPANAKSETDQDASSDDEGEAENHA